MGLFDKLKDAGKKALEASGVTITKLPDELANNKNATFIEADDFHKQGSIKGGDLPEVKGILLYYTIDTDPVELKIAQLISKTFSSKYKLLRTIPLEDIVAFQAVKATHITLSNNSVLHSYYSTITTADGQCYELYQGWTKPGDSSDSSFRIEDEMAATIGLNALLLWFLPLVNDDVTKQWCNDICAERGIDPAFDENGNLDLEKYMENHRAWFNVKSEEWKSRMKAVTI